MTQIELKQALTDKANSWSKLDTIKTVMDYLNQKEKVIGLKEAKDMVDTHWGNHNQNIPTNVKGLLTDVRNYKK